jgi:membrane-associated protease RseP (regulator of RpoE activity)
VRDLPPVNVATTGFLGLQATYPTERVDPVHAAGRSVGDFGQITGAALSGMARFVSPGNISGFVSDTFKTTNDQTATACRTIGPEDENRILSIVGVGRLAAEAGRNGVDQFLRFFALINIFIGVLNLIPLLPFDGGHAVIATYERIRSRKNRPYHLDVAKLLPLSYAVFIAFAALGVLALYRDLLDPVRLGG